MSIETSQSPMAGQRTCSRCGTKVPLDTPAGNCPGCLLQLALTLPADDDHDARGFSCEAARVGQLATGVIRYFGDYELQREIARGGMGVVYQARQVSLKRAVALKMILAGQLATPAQVERFHLEAEAAAKLDHPNIVPIYEIGEHEGQHFYSMKLIQGQNLAQRIAERAARSAECIQPVDRAGIRERQCEIVRWLVQVARAVHYAHQHGLLHRDLKPTNILIDKDGQPHVTDFGLAKLLVANDCLTRTGALLGTPDYMAPEQARGDSRHLSIAVDIYSLGAVFYELMAGHPPFQAATPLETLRRVSEDEPVPLRLLSPQTDRDLETICLTCLNKDPQKRYASAAAVADDLERWLAGEPIAARPAGMFEKLWRRARRDPKLAGLVLTVFALLAVVALGSLLAAVRLARAGNATRRAEQKATEELAAAYLAQASAERRTGWAGQRFDSLAAVARAAAIKPSLALRNEAIAALALPDVRFIDACHSNLDARVRYSPDLASYAAEDDTGAIIVRSARDSQEIARLPAVGAGMDWIFDFSPDGRFLDVRYRNGVHYVWDVVRSAAVLQALPNGQAGAFSPEGRTFWLSRTDGALAAFSLPSGAPVREVQLNAALHSLAFQPQGSHFAGYENGSSILGVYASDSGGKVLELVHPNYLSAWTWSPDGKYLATGCGNGKVFIWDAATGEQKVMLEGHESDVISLGFNHGGDLLATSSWDGTYRFWDLMNARPVLVAHGCGYQACFSLDDQHLGYAHYGAQVGMFELTRSQELRYLPSGDPGSGWAWAMDISPDGRLAAAAYPEGVCFWDFLNGNVIALLPMHGCHSILFTPDRAGFITSSAGGLYRWPIKLSEGAASDELRIGLRQSIRDGLYFAYASLSADGQCVAAANQRAGTVAIYEVTHPKSRFAFSSHPGVNSVSLSPDAHWVASATWNGIGVKVWDLREHKLACGFPWPGSAIVAFSPDNRWLAVGGQTCHVVETRSWRERYSVSKPDTDTMGFVAFSPDSKLLAIRVERQVHLLDTATGDLLAILEVPYHSLLSWLRFSPDGTQLAALLRDHHLAAWDLRRLRAKLASMNLDWDAPAFAPDNSSRPAKPLRATFAPFSPEELAQNIPSRAPETEGNLIDLSSYYNAPLTETWHTQGANEAEGLTNDLSALPRGLQTLAGVQFDVRGVVQLSIPGCPGRYPDRVPGITIAQPCRRLHFLQATAWVVPDGTLIGRYVVRYADGQCGEIPIKYGEDVRDWWVWPGDPKLETKNSVLAWGGTNGATAAYGYSLRVFKSTWENPFPDNTILCIDYERLSPDSAPFLLAITADSARKSD